MTVYVYDITVKDIYSTEDYGTISSAATVTDDFGVGALASAPTYAEDWFSIAATQTQIPFGGMTISGTKTEAKTKSVKATSGITLSGTAGKVRGSSWVGTGTVFEIGSGLPRTIKPYIASGTLRIGVLTKYNTASSSGFTTTGTFSQNTTFDPYYIEYSTALERTASKPPVTTQLFAISGSYTNLQAIKSRVGIGTFTVSGAYNNLKSTKSVVGVGTIKVSALKGEKTTYAYVGLGTVKLSGGNVYAKVVKQPQSTQLFQISGASSNLKKSATPPTNTQLFRISGSYSNLKATDSWAGIGTVKISGSAKERQQPSYVGLGTLFEIGVKKESRTYVYDKTTIVTFTPDDYGLVSQTATLFEDLGTGGTLNTPANQSEDWGLITNGLGVQITGALYPFGTAYFSGQGSWSFVKGTYIAPLPATPVRLYNSNTVFPNIKIIPHYGIEKNIGVGTTGVQLYGGYRNLKSTKSYVGLGTITLSGGNIYAKVVKLPQSTQLFRISGAGVEKFGPNPPENTQLFRISGAYSNLKATKSVVGFGTILLSGNRVEKRTKSYVGVGTITLSGSKVEKFAPNPPENTQLFRISGSSIEKFGPNPPENTQLFQISGAYSNLKSTKSVVGFGTIILSAVKVEKRTKSYVGVGTATFSGQAATNKNRTYQAPVPATAIKLSNVDQVAPNISNRRFIPAYGREKNIGIGTTGIQFRIGVGTLPDGDGNPRDAKTYSNRYGFGVGDFNRGSGIGTIRINDDKGLTICRALIPYISKNGLFKITGTGKESYTRTTYIASGRAVISGIGSTRKISVYTAVASGTINIIQGPYATQISEERSYVGSGVVSVYNNAKSKIIEKKAFAYRGSGTISEISGSANAISRKPTTDVELIKITGSASVSKVSKPPRSTELFVISGSYSNLKKTKSYVGVGTISINGSAKTSRPGKFVASGLIRFVTHRVDNLYDTVDSVNVGSDYLNDAKVIFVANPPENTELFTISGSAITSKRVSRSYVGIAGTFRFSGSATNIKKSKSYAGIGTIFEISSGTTKRIESVKGSGSIAILSGSAKSFTKRPTTTSVLYTISGIASTKINHIVRVSGIGTIRLSGISTAKKLSIASISGIGTIRISGQVVPPNVKFVPKPKTSGTITILGSGKQSLTKKTTGSGSIFVISSGKQSFTRKTYVGLGTVYISSISGITKNNPYQIPRSYVVII